MNNDFCVTIEAICQWFSLIPQKFTMTHALFFISPIKWRNQTSHEKYTSVEYWRKKHDKCFVSIILRKMTSAMQYVQAGETKIILT